MSYTNKTYTCPFYLRNEQGRIDCEGGRVRFPDRTARKLFELGHCASACGGWRGCSLAKMMLDFYEQKEDAK